MRKYVVFVAVVSIAFFAASCELLEAAITENYLEGLITVDEIRRAVGYRGNLKKTVRNISREKVSGQVLAHSAKGSPTFRCEITLSELNAEGEFKRWCEMFFTAKTDLEAPQIGDESRAAILGTHGSRLAFRKGKLLVDVQLFCNQKLVKNITKLAKLLESRV